MLFQDSSDGRESLLSMHEKKRKRKLKEDEEAGVANVRRPFDRELDLQVLGTAVEAEDIKLLLGFSQNTRFSC